MGKSKNPYTWMEDETTGGGVVVSIKDLDVLYVLSFLITQG